MGELTILILQKYVVKVCMVSFGFYSARFNFFYSFNLHKHTAKNNNNIFFVFTIVMSEFNIFILQKYGS